MAESTSLGLAGAAAPLLHTLANGVRLLAVPIPHLQSASVGVFLRVGSRDETPASNGVSHVLEHMAFKGTATRTVQAINLDAERLGADVNAFTSKDTTAYFMSGLGRDADRFLAMTADIVLNSTFPQPELERELDVIRQEAIEYAEDPEESANDLLDRAAWGAHPLGMPVIGTLENLDRFTRDDVVAHVRSHYLAENTVVVAAGSVDPADFFRQAEALFAGMPQGPAPRAPVAAPTYAGQAVGKPFRQVSQVFLNLAWPVLPPPGEAWSAPRWRLAAALAATLFGEGMSAPFTDTVRERLGLAYTAHASTDAGADWCQFIVHAVTTPDKLPPLIAATGSVLREQAQGVDPVHLERARNQLAVGRVRASERAYAAMERAVEDLLVLGRPTAASETLQVLDDIHADEVQAVFARMLEHPPALAMAGKGATLKAARQLAAELAAASRPK